MFWSRVVEDSRWSEVDELRPKQHIEPRQQNFFGFKLFEEIEVERDMSVTSPDPRDRNLAIGEIELPREVRNDSDAGSACQFADFRGEDGGVVRLFFGSGETAVGIDAAGSAD